MSREFRETTLFEDVIKGLSIPGGLMRQTIQDAMTGTREEGAYADILAGRSTVTPRDLIDSLEKKTGLDLKFGDGENPTTFESAANFGTELLLDIFTSPDSLVLGGPTKLLRASKALDKIANPATKKIVERAVTGATFGALTTQPDDDIIDTLQAVSLGAMTFGLGPAALKTGARFVNDVGEGVLDSVILKANSDSVRAIEDAVSRGERTVGSPTKAMDINKKFKKRTALYRKIYVDKTNEVIVDFEQDLIKRGLSPEDIKLKTNELRMFMGEGQENLVSIRNKIKDNSRRKAHAEGKVVNEYDLNRWSTAKANEMVIDKMLTIKQDPAIVSSWQQLVENNKKIGNLYNVQVAERARKLEKLGKVDEANKLKDTMFVPLAFHTVDFKSLDDLATVSDIVGPVKTGARLRTSSEVQKDLTKTFREEVLEGSHRFAALLADETEKEASQLLAKIYSNTEGTLEKLKGRNLFEVMSSKDLTPNEKALGALRTYDKYINLMKTTHLATGTSWLMTNYTDNVVKAYVFASPSTAVNTALSIPTQALAAGANAIDKKLLGGIGNSLTADALDEFAKKSTFQKLLTTFDPSSSAKVGYNDEWMDSAALYGAIDSNKYIDFKRGAQEADGILAVKKGFDDITDQTSVEVVRQMDNLGDAGEFLPKFQNFFWNTVGNIGSAVEGTARYTTFKDVAESFSKQYPGFKRVMDKGNITKTATDYARLPDFKQRALAGKFPMSRIEEIEQTHDVLTKASKITNDIFFDYDNVTAFERHVMKRIFPYWTFFSRNFQQWLEKGFDADTIARTADVSKIQSNSGRPLSQEERMKTPKWLLEKGARVGEDEEGNLTYTYMPNLSLADAINSVQDVAGSTIGKLATPLKVAGEIAANREAFGRDVPVVPTEDNPRKRVLDSALTLLPEGILEKLGIYRDDKGKLFTNSQASAVLLKAQDLAPIPQLTSQFARAQRDALFREKTNAEAALNFFPVLRQFDIDPEQAERNLKANERNIKAFEGGKAEVLRTDGRRRKRRRVRRRPRRRKR